MARPATEESAMVPAIGRVLLSAVLVSSALAGASASQTVDTIRKNGALVCGVSTGVAGFSMPDAQGRWAGFDVDMCRAVAAAILGDAEKVKYLPLSAQQRFTALQTGEIDMLSNRATWTLVRDASLGINFLPIVFYDGQSFMVPRKLGIKTGHDLGAQRGRFPARQSPGRQDRGGRGSPGRRAGLFQRPLRGLLDRRDQPG